MSPNDLDILKHLTKLASEFSYEELYLEAYWAINDLLTYSPRDDDDSQADQTWERIRREDAESVSRITTLALHGHYYTFDEVLEWKRTGDSGLIVLLAEDGAR